MTPSHRRRGLRVGLALATIVTWVSGATPPPALAAPDRPPAIGQATDELRLTRQTTSVAPGGTFELVVDPGSTPEAGSIEVAIHGRVRSRSELAASMEGFALRPVLHRLVTPLAELPDAGDGARRFSLPLDSSAEGGVVIDTAGAYPVEVIGRDETGSPVTSLVTHLLVEPPVGDTSPPLAVAVIADLGLVPELDGATSTLSDRGTERASSLLTAIGKHPGPAAISVSPAATEVLQASTEPAQVALLDALTGAAGTAERAILAAPYAPTSPEALREAGLTGELAIQLDEGRRTLQNVLGAPPSQITWLAGEDLTSGGADLLHDAGVDRLVVRSDQVDPVGSGTSGLSVAQPFAVSEDSPDLLALVEDAAVADHLSSDLSPSLEISRVLAELAVLWFERPGVERATVVRIGPSVRPAVVEGLLAALGRGGILTSVDLDQAFTEVPPLEVRGQAVPQELVPGDPDQGISSAVARDLPGARRVLASVTGLVGPDSPRLRPMVGHLLLSSSVAIDDEEQRGHLDAARAVVTELTESVTATAQETITLTAREGTVPLALRNDSGTPVNVTVRLASPRLEFPQGEVMPVTLTDAVTRIDIAVRVRVSGSFPLEVEVTSPDGELLLARTDYSIQSTAVSGVGIFLSAGAAVFLLVWWGRHWSRTRRSKKLIGVPPPAHRAGRAK